MNIYTGILTNININVNVDVKEIIMSRIKSVGMAKVRPNLTQMVDEVAGGGEPYLIVSGSKVKAVLIGLDQYNDMVERIEDLADAAVLLQSEVEQEPTMTFAEHLGKLAESNGSVPAGN